MKAATPEDEIDGDRETGAPASTLVLMRTRKESRATGSPSRTDDASRRPWLFTVVRLIAIDLWRTK